MVTEHKRLELVPSLQPVLVVGLSKHERVFHSELCMTTEKMSDVCCSTASEDLASSLSSSAVAVETRLISHHNADRSGY